MGRIEKNRFDDGFHVRYDNGTTENFQKDSFGDGYHGDQGSGVRQHHFGNGFTVTKSDGSAESFQENLFGDLAGDQGTVIREGIWGDPIVDTSGTRRRSDPSAGGGAGVPVPSGGAAVLILALIVGAALLFSVKHASEHLTAAFTSLGDEFALIVIPWMLQFIVASILIKAHFAKDNETRFGRILLSLIAAGYITFAVSGFGIFTASAFLESNVGFFEYIIVMPIAILMHSAAFTILFIPTALLEASLISLLVDRLCNSSKGKKNVGRTTWIIIAATCLIVAAAGVTIFLKSDFSFGETADGSAYESGKQLSDTGSLGSANEDAAYESGAYDGYEYDFVLPGSDERYVDSEEVENLDPEETQTAINEIYARHGRIFRDEPYSSRFNSCEWYNPMYSADEFNDDWLNGFEHENIELLAEHRNVLKSNEAEKSVAEGSAANDAADEDSSDSAAEYGEYDEYEMYHSPDTMFNEQAWDWEWGTTEAEQSTILFHEDGTFSEYSHGASVLVEDAGTWTFDRMNEILRLTEADDNEYGMNAGVPREYIRNADDTGVYTFRSEEEEYMAEGNGYIWVKPSPENDCYF